MVKIVRILSHASGPVRAFQDNVIRMDTGQLPICVTCQRMGVTKGLLSFPAYSA